MPGKDFKNIEVLNLSEIVNGTLMKIYQLNTLKFSDFKTFKEN
jgi:hypothetical protein